VDWVHLSLARSPEFAGMHRQRIDRLQKNTPNAFSSEFQEHGSEKNGCRSARAQKI
jgi:hypothetical protein